MEETSVAIAFHMSSIFQNKVEPGKGERERGGWEGGIQKEVTPTASTGTHTRMITHIVYKTQHNHVAGTCKLEKMSYYDHMYISLKMLCDHTGSRTGVAE